VPLSSILEPARNHVQPTLNCQLLYNIFIHFPTNTASFLDHPVYNTIILTPDAMTASRLTVLGNMPWWIIMFDAWLFIALL
jgi:hypothetical protein